MKMKMKLLVWRTSKTTKNGVVIAQNLTDLVWWLRMISYQLAEGYVERYDVKLDDSIVIMKQKVILVVDPILSLLQEFEKAKAHNMMGLMMDAQLKDMRLVFLHWLVKNKALDMSMNMMESQFIQCCWNRISICILHYDQSNTMSRDESSAPLFSLPPSILFPWIQHVVPQPNL